MATFANHVTGMLPATTLAPSSSEPYNLLRSPVNEDSSSGTPLRLVSSPSLIELPDAQSGSQVSPDTLSPIPGSSNARPLFSRSVFISFQKKSAQVPMSRSASECPLRRGEGGQNVGKSGKLQRSVSMINMPGVRYAGEASVYCNEEVGLVPSMYLCDVCSMNVKLYTYILNLARASHPGRKA